MHLTDFDKHKIVEVIANEPDLELAYLYGSFATGLANEDSDVDIGIMVKPDMAECVDFRFEAELALKIENILKKEVDLRTLNKAPVYAKYQILKQGQLLYASSDKVRVDYECYVLSRYFDMKHMWNLYDNYREERLKRGEFGG